MVAAFILVMSVMALVHFAISQWRSIWIVVAEQPLSSCFETSTGIAADSVTAEDFSPLMRALDQLPVTSCKRSSWLKEVGMYYRILQALSNLCEQSLPALANRARKEAVVCAKYVAAVLDQRLSAHLAYSAQTRN